MMRVPNKSRFRKTLSTLALAFFPLLTGCQDVSVRHYNRAMGYLDQDQYDQAI